ncbi:hypothetical protein [Streptomyces cacaoi]
MTLRADHGLEALDEADTVIVPGTDVLGATPEPVRGSTAPPRSGATSTA